MAYRPDLWRSRHCRRLTAAVYWASSAGGGFLVVPALALLGGLPMPIAVGTSLVVIAMKSFAGLGGYLSSVQIDWTVAAAVTAAALTAIAAAVTFACARYARCPLRRLTGSSASGRAAA